MHTCDPTLYAETESDTEIWARLCNKKKKNSQNTKVCVHSTLIKSLLDTMPVIKPVLLFVGCENALREETLSRRGTDNRHLVDESKAGISCVC